MYAIEARDLSKRYRLAGAYQSRYHTLRDAVSGFMKRGGRTSPDEATSDLWALRDVSFAVREGEALGIIGRNGAGKSTLLKILSRITEPTTGRARMRGRVASLLEVGTGFHPELTGRENIYLNATILGMRRAEIRQNFDAIVAFAEVERFLETPVKHYSSGMYMRLAFGVAAYMTPEILIVDEVLAVGDFEFQRRCLGKMNEVAHSGRTVLFVSHNMSAIEELCPQSILLKGGRVERSGPTRDVVAHYLSSGSVQSGWGIDGETEREGTGNARITRLELLPADADLPLANLVFRQSFRVRIHYAASKRLPDPRFGFAFLSEAGERVFQTETSEVNFRVEAIERGERWFDCLVSEPNLLPGAYFLEAWIVETVNVAFADHIFRAGRIDIGVDAAQQERLAYLTHPGRGRVYMDCRWSSPDPGKGATLAG
jgi:lipopolysaccharide transport system ATP-binding protein